MWAADRSGGFGLIDRTSIGEPGVLILPKLFRRATDYLSSRDKGEAESFLGWLRDATVGGDSENDQVELDGRRVKLADLITEAGTRIALNADLHELVFVEK